ncbi:MAG: ATP-binding protein [Muribaculaceae bacterium]|nr:ATP-binding protein [Muribaculaceae bacterium]
MEEKRVRYPIGEQSFERLRRDGFLYVDKTEYIEKIVGGSKYFFLGRPRRFGKSLFLSTLKCFYEGKRELFKDLYIDTVDWNWEVYPVLYLDLNTSKYKKDGDLEDVLDRQLRKWEKEYDVDVKDKAHAQRFATIIETVSKRTGKEVVILVDEYDKPLVTNLHHPKRFEEYRDALADLYSNFKSAADYIKLVFLTGVTRFAKLSVFSGLNNISDISFVDKFAGICGITESELKSYFIPGIKELSVKYKRSFEEEIQELKRNYDGYHFSEDCPDIYNPYSLLQVMDYSKYSNYWISSGTPTILVEQLQKIDADLEEFLTIRASQNMLEGLDMDSPRPIALLYQTGYLTIKKFDERRRLYHLGIPNEEVKQGFFEFLLPYYTSLAEERVAPFIFDLIDEIESGDVDAFMKRLQSLFAGYGHDLKFDEERNVQNAMLLIFSLVGMHVDAEVRNSDGRIDILVRTREYVYIMELKYDKSSEEALAQIERKEYALPWSIDSRSVIAIGINYSSVKRRIDGWSEKRLI